jgi:HSP20 family molecular chaperone IbpA
MKHTSGVGTAPRREAEGEPVLVADQTERVREIDRAIAERAYELFEERGYAHGNDLEDWFRAEAEMLQPVSCSLEETTHAVTVVAPVRGFTASELAVTVEPQRLVVCGKHQEGARGKPMVRCAIDLPAEIDPSQAKAVLRGELLGVLLPKARPS